MKKIDNNKAQNTEKLVIATRAGSNKASAEYYRNGELLLEFETRCHPNDDFDFTTAAQLTINTLKEDIQRYNKKDFYDYLHNGVFGYIYEQNNDGSFDRKKKFFIYCNGYFYYRDGGYDSRTKWDGSNLFDENGYDKGYARIGMLMDACCFDNAKTIANNPDSCTFSKYILWRSPYGE